jgi:thiamine kinase-like enzyme
MLDRREHHQEVRSFLQKHFPTNGWSFSLPHGSGTETYFARGNEQEYFVKVGVTIERYLVMAELDLTPPILSFGELENGLSIIVQPLVIGRKPTRREYRHQLERVAALIHKMHHHPRVKGVLSPAPSNLHKDAGLRSLNSLRQKWEHYKAQVPNVAPFVDKSLDYLAQQVNLFSTEGLVTSHNDICNANWLFADNGKIYVIDFESISVEDPALDMGALLWWYYPPALRQRFLDIAGYVYDEEFRFRMQIRMAMHCLSITLPREQSFDRFDDEHYSEALNDFRAILAGKENPQGYGSYA